MVSRTDRDRDSARSGDRSRSRALGRSGSGDHRSGDDRDPDPEPWQPPSAGQEPVSTPAVLVLEQIDSAAVLLQVSGADTTGASGCTGRPARTAARSAQAGTDSPTVVARYSRRAERQAPSGDGSHGERRSSIRRQPYAGIGTSGRALPTSPPTSDEPSSWRITITASTRSHAK